MNAELVGSHSQFAQRRLDYVDLLARLAPEKPNKLLCCGAELMSYFLNGNNWKGKHYRERWFYQALRRIYKDLTCAYSLHTIRQAIALLVELGILLVKKNDRELNSRNGQDKTHAYLIDSSRLEAALADLASQSKESKKGRKKSQPAIDETRCVNDETRCVNDETRCVSVETHTKIYSIDSSKNSSSLLEEREEMNFVQEEEVPDPWTVDEDEVEQEELASLRNTQEIPQKQEDSGEDQFSAALDSNYVELTQANPEPLPKPECSEVLQSDLKPLPKLKSDRLSGFRSDAERDGFYQALLELGKSQGKKSPAAWSSTIIKSINAGEPCQYLSEYREGQQVGSSEKQEWEIAPGQVFPLFISYLKTSLKKPEMTDEQAIAAAHQQLKDVNLARSLWEFCKRCIANLQDDWEKQKQLGVQNAYLHPELLPEREVSVEELRSAIASLQAGSIQLQGLPETAARAELEPAKELSSDPEPAPPSPAELQERLNSPALAALARMTARNLGYHVEDGLIFPADEMPSVETLRSLLANPLTAPKVERLIAAHREWGLWIDEGGELQDF